MSDDYLWDKSGKPDPDVQRLERSLGRLKHDRPAPLVVLPLPRRRRPWFARTLPRLAAAAAILAVAAGLWLRLRPVPSGWSVQALAGAPRVGRERVSQAAPLVAGEWVETDTHARARIRTPAVGELELDPESRLRLVRARRGAEQRFALERGTVHAVIWARPRQLAIETPAAVAVDLGCAYTLTVDHAGVGHLEVSAGWVAFEWQGREWVVPRDARCETHPGRAPGTPYFGDAKGAFLDALQRLDYGDLRAAERSAALDDLLAAARPRDALTLWHLLTGGSAAERARVAKRLAELVPPPAGVTVAGVLDGDRDMLDRWWDALGLGETTWWRMWKAEAPRPKR